MKARGARVRWRAERGRVVTSHALLSHIMCTVLRSDNLDVDLTEERFQFEDPSCVRAALYLAERTFQALSVSSSDTFLTSRPPYVTCCTSLTRFPRLSYSITSQGHSETQSLFDILRFLFSIGKVRFLLVSRARCFKSRGCLAANTWIRELLPVQNVSDEGNMRQKDESISATCLWRFCVSEIRVFWTTSRNVATGPDQSCRHTIVSF